MLHWFTAAPIAAAAVLGLSLAGVAVTGWMALCALMLVGAVIAAVHHAEVVAHRVGEPFGTLVLAVAITVIEVALIVSMMLAGGPDKATLPRDTIYSAVMIICTGVVGLCLLVGGWHHHEQNFRLDGSNSALAALVALAGLSLVMPTFTTSAGVGLYTVSQLVFVGLSSVALWLVFVFVQTVRHRDYFLPPSDASNESEHAEPPSDAQAWASFGLLLVALVSVVGLAKQLSPTIEAGVAALGAPKR